jgi:chromosome segregation ATPase
MKKYDRLQMIENGSYEEFLLWREASQAGAFNKKVKAKMALLNDQIKELKAEKKELKAQIKELKASTEYKIGRKVTWLPRKIDSIKQQREQSNENQSDQAVDNDLKADKDTLPEEE